MTTTTLHERATPQAGTADVTVVHDLPPLHVTTVGIPPDEHITERESHRRERALWRSSDRVAWLSLWALVLLLGFFLAAAANPAPALARPSVAWSDYRGGERVSAYTAELSPSFASPFTGLTYAAIPAF